MTHAMAAKTGKSMQDLIDELRQKKEHLKQGGGADRLAKQKGQGKLTARERIEQLMDPGSPVHEVGTFVNHGVEYVNGLRSPGAGVVTVATAESARAAVDAGSAEAMTVGLPETVPSSSRANGSTRDTPTAPGVPFPQPSPPGSRSGSMSRRLSARPRIM